MNFSLLQGKMYAPEKSGTPQGFCALGHRARNLSRPGLL